MGATEIIIGGVVLILFIVIAYKGFKDIKQGKTGCSDCSKCAYNCEQKKDDDTKE